MKNITTAAACRRGTASLAFACSFLGLSTALASVIFASPAFAQSSSAGEMNNGGQPTAATTSADRTASPSAISPMKRDEKLAAQATPAHDPLDSLYLTGGWGGYRAKLIDSGITPRADINMEAMGIASGGVKTGLRYNQQVRLGADFDMARIAGWDDGRFHFTLNDRTGRSTSADLLGNRYPIQENVGGQYTRLTEFSFDQNAFDKKLNYKLGWFAMGNDFGMTQLLTNFVNAALCAHPLAMSADSGWYNYPNARWGGELTFHFTKDVLVRTGAFEVNSDLGTKQNAFNPFGGRATGALLPVEIAYEPGAGGPYPAHYKLGYYYDTSTAKDQADAFYSDSRQGGYIMLDQKVTTVEGDNGRGLSLFLQFMKTDKSTSAIENWFSTGWVYQGLFPSRPKDTLAFGFVTSDVNSELLAHAQAKLVAQHSDLVLTPSERLYELSYGFQVTPWATVRPDVQYIQYPGTFSYKDKRDAVAVGLQTKLTF